MDKYTNAEKLKRYLSADTVDRLSILVPLTNLKVLEKNLERLRNLASLNESVLNVLSKINSNLGVKQDNGHYESCSWNQYNHGPDTCMCVYFRFDLYDIEKFITAED